MVVSRNLEDSFQTSLARLRQEQIGQVRLRNHLGQVRQEAYYSPHQIGWGHYIERVGKMSDELWMLYAMLILLMETHF